MGFVPTLTPEQRAAALEKAAAARRQRRELRDALKNGDTTFAEVLDRSDYDDILAKTKLTYVLESLPRVGRTKARVIMDTVGIATSRNLTGLGGRQRTELLDLLA